MTIVIILFFFSLAAILVMMGRKLMLLRSGVIQMIEEEVDVYPFSPDWEKVKEVTTKGTKKYGYVTLVAAIRMYVKSSNFLRSKSSYVSGQIKRMLEKSGENGEILGPQEVNKFLKMMTEYKHKIRNIKHRVSKEEEKNL